MIFIEKAFSIKMYISNKKYKASLYIWKLFSSTSQKGVKEMPDKQTIVFL